MSRNHKGGERQNKSNEMVSGKQRSLIRIGSQNESQKLEKTGTPQSQCDKMIL